MLFVPLFIGFCVQLVVCCNDIRVMGKLVPVFIEGALAAGLSVPVFAVGQANMSADTRFVLLFYALLAFSALAGGAIAWLIFGATYIVSRRRKRSMP